MSEWYVRPGAGGQAVEWIGGIVAMPGTVTGEGEAYRPEGLFWMGADGSILGSVVAKPGELLPMASESLQHTIDEPVYGTPHTPTRVRVACDRLAAALREGHPALEVVCGPTPELDELLALLEEEMGEIGAMDLSYLGLDASPEAMASLFEAAAALYRAAPWEVTPDDRSLFNVTIEQLDVRDAVMSVVGQNGQSVGLVLFADLFDFKAYREAGKSRRVEDVPPHFSLNFERGADLAPTLRKEIARHGWEVAGPTAYPWPVAVDGELVARMPIEEEVTVAEAIARALVAVVADAAALRQAWEGGEPFSRTLAVPTHQGEIDVTLRAPYVASPPAPRSW